ncbi:MAG: ABC transporter substrate-binding protein [Chloroflexota bacterium]
MNRRLPGIVATLALVAPVLAACGSSSSNAPTPAATKATKVNPSGALPKDVTKPPPSDPYASAAKKYSGQTITYYGDGIGIGHDMDIAAAQKFTKQTGINVNIVIKPSDSNAAYSTYQRLFTAQSNKIDAMMLDVIWPGSFGPDLLNLSPAMSSTIKQYYPSIVTNDTVGGHLVAVPWFSDFGMLYYRKDLLQKYSIASPPATWAEMAADAKKIQAGEQKTNKAFYGFVYQGKPYEGLTCDATEWLTSAGAGNWIQNGKVNLDNPKATAMLSMVQGWVGSISPKDVTTYTEVESDNAFNNGDAAFMRNWPYAFAVAQQQPKVKGKVAVTALPHQPGQQSTATVGGWQLGVSKFSSHPGAATAWVKYLTSPQVETWRAVVGSFVPSIPSLNKQASVVAAEPFLATTANAIRVTRPSKFLGVKYNQGSNLFWQAVSQIENGSSPSSVLPATGQQLNRLTGS